MSALDIRGLREQILANATFILRAIPQPQVKDNMLSSLTLVEHNEPLHVIVSSEGTTVRGVLMLGIKPAIEGGEANTPESALRKLLLAVIETTSLYLPKVGGHMRNIHGGGVFDEDLISQELQAQKKMLDSKPT